MAKKKVNRKKKSNSNFIQRIVKKLWLFFFVGLGIFALLMLLVSLGVFGKLPDIHYLANPKTTLASEIYSADGKTLGKFFFREDRTNIKFDELPEDMVNALVATEDVRFYKHSGIDFRRLASAIVFLGSRGGASTISQQLAKNLFHQDPPRTHIGRIMQKLKEWIIAVQLERLYTKQEIIQWYFNTVPWQNSYGIKSASKTFFNKKTKDLKIEESAMLVGMLKASGLYNPVRYYDRAVQRRNVVMHQMKKYGYLKPQQYDSLKQLDIVLDYNRSTHNSGIATYFREYLRQYLKKWASNNGYNIYTDGLKIYTTINYDMQKYAEDAVKKHMTNLQAQFFAETNRTKLDPWKSEESTWAVDKEYIPKHLKKTLQYKHFFKKYKGNEAKIDEALNNKIKMTIYNWRSGQDSTVNMSVVDSLKYYKQILHCGFMAMHPASGEVLAWVGGRNFEHFQYDHVNKNSNRQVGSTFKPLVYARALDDEKIQPCQKVSTGPVTIETPNGQTWTPKNSGKVSNEEVTLYNGLAHSINTVTARVMKSLGDKAPEAIIEIAANMGIDEDKFMPYPSICLGVMDVSVFEMVGAYSTFVNLGEYVEPIFIQRIEDKYGNVLKEFVPTRQEAMREQTAYTVLKMLEKVTQGGTATRLKTRYGVPYAKALAGKTGTTQNNSDGWFMGVSPNIVGGCWVGCDDRQVHFTSTAYGQGANMALPIFAYFIKSVYENPKYASWKNDDFRKPKSEISFKLDCAEYEEKINIDNKDTEIDGLDI